MMMPFYRKGGNATDISFKLDILREIDREPRASGSALFRSPSDFRFDFLLSDA